MMNIHDRCRMTSDAANGLLERGLFRLPRRAARRQRVRNRNVLENGLKWKWVTTSEKNNTAGTTGDGSQDDKWWFSVMAAGSIKMRC